MRPLPLITSLVLLLGCHLGSPRKEERRANSGDPQPQAPAPTPGQPPETRVSTGGVIDGNGGELIGNEHNPWFVGKGPVPFCIQRSDDFSLAAKDASEEIGKAFAAWKGILTEQRFGGVGRSYEGRPSEDPHRKLVRDFVEVDCSTTPPLVFKLGVVDAPVEAALKFSAAMTLGFALRTSYDEPSGRAQGFVWITPDRGPRAYQGPKVAADFWSQPHLFRNVVSHEIGHVFGFQHIKGSILDARLPARAVELGFDLPWSGQEFLVDKYTAYGFCGEFLYAEPEALEVLWQLPSAAGVSVCLRWRDDLRGDADDTPVMIQVKAANAETKETLVSLEEGDTDDAWLVGLYPEADEAGKTAYLRTWFGSVLASAIYRGKMPNGTDTLPIEIEMPVPGAFVLRIPLKGRWQRLSIVPAERKEFFLKMFQLLSED